MSRTQNTNSAIHFFFYSWKCKASYSVSLFAYLLKPAFRNQLWTEFFILQLLTSHLFDTERHIKRRAETEQQYISEVYFLLSYYGKTLIVIISSTLLPRYTSFIWLFLFLCMKTRINRDFAAVRSYNCLSHTVFRKALKIIDSFSYCS